MMDCQQEIERHHARLARGDRIIVMVAIAGILALVAVFKIVPEILPLS
jgi:hypothetical protein